MKAWQLDRLGGNLTLNGIAMPEIRTGSVLVRIEASALMSYLKAYVEDQLPMYNPPKGAFTPGTNGVGVVPGAPSFRVLCERVGDSTLFQSTGTPLHQPSDTYQPPKAVPVQQRIDKV
jgi:NADPH:quinone reductase-like Zn-dependent oxidoreductase